MNEYEINDETLAVIPVNHYSTKIIELNRDIIVNKNAYEIMDDSCKYYGSTYKGRLNASKKILDCAYKVPILIEESQNIVFFPTKSSLEEDCCWINFKTIKSVNKNNYNSEVLFCNDKNFTFNTSKLSIENQISRSLKLSYIIQNRKLKKD